MSLNEKYPYLTAWIGFVACLMFSGLILGLIFSGFNFAVASSFLYFCGGFVVFRLLVQHHLTGKIIDHHRDERVGFLTAWVGFFVLHLIPSSIIYYFSMRITHLGLAFLVNLVLWTICNFYIFRFVIKRHIVPVVLGDAGD